MTKTKRKPNPARRAAVTDLLDQLDNCRRGRAIILAEDRPGFYRLIEERDAAYARAAKAYTRYARLSDAARREPLDAPHLDPDREVTCEGWSTATRLIDRLDRSSDELHAARRAVVAGGTEVRALDRLILVYASNMLEGLRGFADARHRLAGQLRTEVELARLGPRFELMALEERADADDMRAELRFDAARLQTRLEEHDAAVQERQTLLDEHDREIERSRAVADRVRHACLEDARQRGWAAPVIAGGQL